MSIFRDCWVINNKTGDCWRIDEDDSKPIYLKNGWPTYDRSRMMDYRLSNYPSEEYREKHKEADGQMSIYDFME